MRVLRLSVCSTVSAFDDLQFLQDAFEQLFSDSGRHLLERKGGLMEAESAVKMPEVSLLEKLADRVQELYLKTQAALPIDRVKSYALYREAYLAHRAHKIFIVEQESLLLKTAY